MLSDRIITNNPFVPRAEMHSVAQSSTTSVHHCVFSPKVPGSSSQQIKMDKATLNLKLSSLEGTPEESISDTISLADGLERLDDLCEGNCRQQLQLVLQRANSMIKLKDSQCKDKDDLILSLKKSIEMQNTIDSLKTQLKLKENPIETNLTLESLEDHIKKHNLDLKQHEDADYETNLKEKDNQLANQIKELKDNFKQQMCALEKKINEKDNQLSKLQADLLSESNKIKELSVINENFKKRICELEKNETKEKLSKWESKAKAAEAKHENDQLVFGSSTWYPFDPEKNSGVAHIKIPGGMSFTAPLENGIKEAGPGWLVMQRRLNGKIEFRGVPFCNSFGDFEGDFWLGLDMVHQLTTHQRCELFIHLVDFENKSKYACYDHFIIGNRFEEYKLKSLGAYSGNAGDALRKHENCIFQREDDVYSFWIAHPTGCNLNGLYYDTETTQFYGIWWGNQITLKSVQMLIKPKSNNL